MEVTCVNELLELGPKYKMYCYFSTIHMTLARSQPVLLEGITIKSHKGSQNTKTQSTQFN